MNKNEFVSALKTEAQDIQVSSRLRQKTLDAAYGKEQIRMKKRTPTLVLAVVLSVVFCAAALAIAGRAGMLDFVRQYDNVYIPENAAEYVENDVLTMENELFRATVRESYYDGLTFRMTMEIAPRQDDVLLLPNGEGWEQESGWKWLNRFNPSGGDEDMRSPQEVFEEGKYTAAYYVCMDVSAGSELLEGESWDCSMDEDGAVVICYQMDYRTDIPERTAEIRVYTAGRIGADGEIVSAGDPVYEARGQLALADRTKDEEVYVSDGPVLCPESGIRIDRVWTIVKPLDIYVFIQYSQADGHEGRFDQMTKYCGVRLKGAGSEEEDQRLMRGMNLSSGSRIIQDTETGMKSVLSWTTLGRNELRGSYTIEIYNPVYRGETIETVTVTMREAMEEEIAEEAANK